LGEVTEAEGDRATDLARRAVALAPGLPDAHHIMGLVMSGQGRYISALDNLNLAWAMNPGSEFILCDMAAVHLALNQPQETVHLLEGKFLRNGWSYYILALAWAKQGYPGRALINFHKARHLGFGGYWLEKALDGLEKEIGFLPVVPEGAIQGPNTFR
jgi:tetratricopeptide (TPR) repeat protein